MNLIINKNIKLIHSSCVVNSDRNIQEFINEQLAGTFVNERLSNLKLIKYESSPSAPMAHSESSDVSGYLKLMVKLSTIMIRSNYLMVLKWLVSF